MRLAGFAMLLIAACVTPALAQKYPPPGPTPAAPASPSAPAAPASPSAPAAPATPAAGSVAVELAETCLRFVNGDAGAADAARAEGWTVDEYPAADSFVAASSASRNVAGIGDANLFGAIETSPRFTLRSCRIDIIANADAGQVGIETLTGWHGFEGTVRTTASGAYGSWDLALEDPERVMVMTAHQNTAVSLTISSITAEAAN